jgi:hypothetical protein
MAVLVDETCVAQSNRSMVSLQYAYAPSAHAIAGGTPSGLPWRRQALELVEDLALERLPEHLTAAIRDRRAQAAVDRAASERTERGADDVSASALAEPVAKDGPDPVVLAPTSEPVAA